jgi:Undecaprenyl-phosphate glucose phosphotransferase
VVPPDGRSLADPYTPDAAGGTAAMTPIAPGGAPLPLGGMNEPARRAERGAASLTIVRRDAAGDAKQDWNAAAGESRTFRRAAGQAPPRRATNATSEAAALFADLFCALDAVVIIATGAAVFRATEITEHPPLHFWLTMVLAAGLAGPCFQRFRVHAPEALRSRFRAYFRLSLCWAVVALAVAALFAWAAAPVEAIPPWLGLWLLGVWPALLLTHVFGDVLLRRWQADGRLNLHVAVLSFGSAGPPTLRALKACEQVPIRVVGCFGPAFGDDAAKADPGSGLDALLRLLREVRVDEVIVAAPLGGGAPGLRSALRRLALLPVNVKLHWEFEAPEIAVLGVGTFADLPFFVLSERPIQGWARVAKRMEDLVLGTLMLIALSPAMLAVAVLVKLSSPGPVFFRQERYGFNNNLITVFKFRTMYCDSAHDCSVPQARRHDPRVTPVGRILRQTSLDELPQLINVLLGDMSLVGPRPHAVPHNEYYGVLIDGYLSRHRVKPGITGWAQINGLRGETDTVEKMRRRLQYDLVYIDNWSLLFDLRIIAATARVMLSDANAY